MRWLQQRSAAKRRPAAPAAASLEGPHLDDDLGTAEAWEWEHVDAQSCSGFSSEGSFSCHDMGDLDSETWPHLEEGFWQEESTGLSVPPQCRMARPGLGPLLGQWADSIGHTVAATVAGAVEVPALASCCRPPSHLRVEQGPSDAQGAEEDPLDLVASGCLAPVGWCCGDGSKLGSCMRTSSATPTWREVVRDSVADWMFHVDE